MDILRLIRNIQGFAEKLNEDHVSAYSAMTSYFMLMSTVPFLMLLLMSSRLFPFSADDVMNLLNSFSLVHEYSFIQTILDEIFAHSNTTVVGLTIVTLLWAASKGIWAIIQGLNSIYNTEETRNTFLLRFVAIIYTIALMLILIVSLILLVFGSSIHSYVLAHFPRIAPVVSLLMKLKEIFSFFVLTVFFLILYNFVPSRKTTFKTEIIGAVFASLGWSLFSFGFSIYVSHFSRYTTLYGSLGTILLFFLWLYMLMYIMFLGAEINYFLSKDGKKRLQSFYF